MIQPTTIASTDYQVARKPTLGGEIEVWASPDEAYEFSTVEYATANSGVQTNHDYNVLATIHTSGSDLAVVIKEYFNATASVTVNFVGTDENGAAMTGAATIAPPGWATQDNYRFPEGAAFDITPTAPTYTGKKWKTIGYAGHTGGTISATSAFRIFSFPVSTSFKQTSCNTSVEYATPIRPAIAIPCGMDGVGGGVKAGRTEQPTISVRGKYRAYVDGLGKYAGKPCTLRIRVKKEARLIVEDNFLGNCRLTSKPSHGDGNDESSIVAEGLYEYFASAPAM